MRIYIAYDRNDDPVAVVLSDSCEKANIAFISMKISHVRIEEVDPSEEGLGMHGIVFLFGSREIDIGSGMDHRTMKILKRGL